MCKESEDRELAKFETKVYLPPIWHNDNWYKARFPGNKAYCHVYRDNPMLVCYFPDAETLKQDRPIKTKPGRFLKKYFGDVLTEEEIKQQVDRHRECFASVPVLKFARTAEEITNVYSMQATFWSCMQYDTSTWEYNGKPLPHPVIAYAAGDLSIAYLAMGERLVARALVWEKEHRVGRVYGDVPLLRKALRTYGIDTNSDMDNFDSMVGARLRKIVLPPIRYKKDYSKYIGEDVDTLSGIEAADNNDVVLLPSMDMPSYGATNLRFDGNYFIVSDTPEQYAASHEHGVHTSRANCPNCKGWVAAGYNVETKLGTKEWCFLCAHIHSYMCSITHVRCSLADYPALLIGPAKRHEGTARASISSTKGHVEQSDYSGYWFAKEQIVSMPDGKRWSLLEREMHGDLQVDDTLIHHAWVQEVFKTLIPSDSYWAKFSPMSLRHDATNLTMITSQNG